MKKKQGQTVAKKTAAKRKSRVASTSKVADKVSSLIKRQVHQWFENPEDGVWKFKDDDLEVYVSLWEHIDIKNVYTACVRWVYKEIHYATYLKFREESGELEKLLIHAGGFCTGWLGERREEEEAEAKKKVEILA